jgi:glycosyltransferase involved in cell wall biosynthesis
VFFLKPLFRRELKLVLEYEQQSFNWFDKHIIISEQDREWLNATQRNEVTVIPNGIDLNYFQRHTLPEDKFDITFTGNMNYTPNIDAAIFLVRKIMPLVWKKFPDVSVQIAGAHPNRKVKELASEKVIVTGWVSDIRESYNRSRIFIAPMRMGTGLQNKLLEAMAMELPCITTSISCTPLGAAAGRDILVGNNSVELANHVINLLEDSSLSQRIATNGYNFVKENFALELSAEKLEKVLLDIQN